MTENKFFLLENLPIKLFFTLHKPILLSKRVRRKEFQNIWLFSTNPGVKPSVFTLSFLAPPPRMIHTTVSQYVRIPSSSLEPHRRYYGGGHLLLRGHESSQDH